MPTYIALLRAVNVGGTGKLPMTELKTMCAAEGFIKIQTYIASGNVVFAAQQNELKVKSAIEKRLHAYAGEADGAPPHDALDHIRGQNGEVVAVGTREIYVAYGAGMGSSKLKIPAAAAGTARNINTVKKLA